MNGCILGVCGINKSLFSVPILENVQFEVFPDEVHVLLGESGAGKPTLIKILSDAYGREGGDIQFDGRRLAPMIPREALDVGISVIYQELNLVLDLPVYESIFVGGEYGQGPPVNHERAVEEAEGYMKWVGLEVGPETLVREPSVAQKRLAEIAKTISNHVRVLILDEPAAAIMDKKTNMLFEVIRELQKEKTGIMYISHRMNGLFGTGDRCTVVCSGEHIGTVKLSEIIENQLTKAVTGRAVGSEKIVNEAVDMNQVVLKVERLRYKESLKDISFELHKDEILGSAGLVRADRTEVTKCMIGAYRKDGGTATYKGETLSSSLSRNIEKGIIYLNEDRKDEELMLMHSVVDDTALPNLKQLAKPFICKKEMVGRIKGYIRNLRIRTRACLTEAKNLSGGNQQRVVIAKWLYSNAGVYISDRPTRGIDVGTRDEIYNVMYNLVSRGASAIMTSSDLMEVLKMCDQATVMREGVLETILDNGLDLTQEAILKYVMQGGLQV